MREFKSCPFGLNTLLYNTTYSIVHPGENIVQYMNGGIRKESRTKDLNFCEHTLTEEEEGRYV